MMGKPVAVPEPVAELARNAVRELDLAVPCDIGWVRRANRGLADLSRSSLWQGCLAFRIQTNTVRIAESVRSSSSFSRSPGLEVVRGNLQDGRLMVTGFNPTRTRAMSGPGDVLSISADRLMVTGVQYAEHVLLEAVVDDDATSSLLLVPTTSITSVVRPRMRGLNEADNALISVEADLPASVALFSCRAEGQSLIEAPYRAGLTLGAVALGALDATVDELRRLPGAVVSETLGSGVAIGAAARALVEACSSAHGDAGWASRAAKVFATEAAIRVIASAGELAGAAAYGADHPLTRLADDIAGLPFQAPTNQGSLAFLSERADEAITRLTRAPIGAPR